MKTDPMKVQVIVAAGGTGARMMAGIPKPLLLLAGKPMVVHTLRVFDIHPQVNGIVLVVHEHYLDEYSRVVRTSGFSKTVTVIPGGATRTQSIRLGIRRLDEDTSLVMVHDAARPLVTARMIDEGIAAALVHKAAVAAVPVKATLKTVDPGTGMVVQTLDRSVTWEIQTPQTFERNLLERAYADPGEATDDSALVERLGCKVKVYMGDYQNIKITTPEDISCAEILLKRNGGGR